MDRTANAGTTLKWSVGSNPTLSATMKRPGDTLPGPLSFLAEREPKGPQAARSVAFV